MAKAIKRVGVMLLAVAIICLMAIGVILGISNAESVTNSNDNSLNFDAKSNNMQNVADNSFTLSGTTAQMAAKWNEACELSASTNSAVYVKLEQDWIANSDARHTFGAGVGFNQGAIYVYNTDIILDLNGHKIDRRLTKETAIENGVVIHVLIGKLTVVDETDRGIITGGANISSRGSGIIVERDGELNFYGGNIANNYTESHGAGIGTYHSKVNIYGGSIVNNTAKYAGGIIAYEYSIVNMYGGNISNNYASSYGGGVYVYTHSEFNFYKGKINNNTASHGGGIRCYNNSTFTMYGGEIADNTAISYGGGIDILKDCTVELNSGKIYNNTAAIGGITYSVDTTNLTPGRLIIGADIHIYNNYSSKYGIIGNIYLKQGELIYIKERLSSANVGVTLASDYGSGVFTSGYKASGNTLNPNRFFTSDKDGLVASASGNEVILSSGTKPTQTASWNWTGAGTGSSTTGYQVVPYTGSAYTITSSVGTFYDKTNASYTALNITDAGVYSLYVNGNYLNPTFTFVIEPKEVDLV